MRTVLPITTCPACWQHKDALKYYCEPCQERLDIEDGYDEPHGVGACEDLRCRLCYGWDDEVDRDIPEDFDPDYDEPYGERDFREDVGL